MDFDIRRERVTARAAGGCGRRSDAREGWATHNQIADGEAFEKWFYEDSGFEGFEMRREDVQPIWRDVV